MAKSPFKRIQVNRDRLNEILKQNEAVIDNQKVEEDSLSSEQPANAPQTVIENPQTVEPSFDPKRGFLDQSYPEDNPIAQAFSFSPEEEDSQKIAAIEEKLNAPSEISADYNQVSPDNPINLNNPSVSFPEDAPFDNTFGSVDNGRDRLAPVKPFKNEDLTKNPNNVFDDSTFEGKHKELERDLGNINKYLLGRKTEIEKQRASLQKLEQEIKSEKDSVKRKELFSIYKRRTDEFNKTINGFNEESKQAGVVFDEAQDYMNRRAEAIKLYGLEGSKKDDPVEWDDPLKFYNIGIGFWKGLTVDLPQGVSTMIDVLSRSDFSGIRSSRFASPTADPNKRTERREDNAKFADKFRESYLKAFDERTAELEKEYPITNQIYYDLGAGASNLAIMTGASLINPALGVSVGFAIEGGSAANEAIRYFEEKGYDVDEDVVQGTMWAVGAVNSLLEYLPISKIVARNAVGNVVKELMAKGTLKTLGKIARKQAFSEGITETIQSYASTIAEELYKDQEDKPSKDWISRYVTQPLYEGLIGGILGAATGSIEVGAGEIKLRKELAPELEKMIAAKNYDPKTIDEIIQASFDEDGGAFQTAETRDVETGDQIEIRPSESDIEAINKQREDVEKAFTDRYVTDKLESESKEESTEKKRINEIDEEIKKNTEDKNIIEARSRVYELEKELAESEGDQETQSKLNIAKRRLETIEEIASKKNEPLIEEKKKLEEEIASKFEDAKSKLSQDEKDFINRKVDEFFIDNQGRPEDSESNFRDEGVYENKKLSDAFTVEKLDSEQKKQDEKKKDDRMAMTSKYQTLESEVAKNKRREKTAQQKAEREKWRAEDGIQPKEKAPEKKSTIQQDYQDAFDILKQGRSEEEATAISVNLTADEAKYIATGGREGTEVSEDKLNQLAQKATKNKTLTEVIESEESKVSTDYTFKGQRAYPEGTNKENPVNPNEDLPEPKEEIKPEETPVSDKPLTPSEDSIPEPTEGEESPSVSDQPQGKEDSPIEPKVGYKEKEFNSKVKREGKSQNIEMADGSKRKAKYVLVELDDIIPSHDPLNGFAISQGYPRTRDGKSVNSRDYQNNKKDQAYTLTNANPKKFSPAQLINNSPSPSSSVPIISKDGIVVSGNGRTMIMKAAFRHQESKTAYKNKLKEDAAVFGFDANEIEGMNSPVVVLIDEDFSRYAKDELHRYNQENQKVKTFDEQVKLFSEILSDPQYKDSLEQIMNDMGNYSTLSLYFRAKPSVANRLKNVILETGITTRDGLAALYNESTGTFSETGQKLIEQTFISTVIGDKAYSMLDNSDLSDFKGKIISALPVLAKMKTLEKGNLLPYLSEALEIEAAFREWMGQQDAAWLKEYKKNNSTAKLFDYYLTELDTLFGRPSYNGLLLNRVFDSNKNEIKSLLNGYIDAMLREEELQKNEGGMFGVKPLPFEETFNNLLVKPFEGIYGKENLEAIRKFVGYESAPAGNEQDSETPSGGKNDIDSNEKQPTEEEVKPPKPPKDDDKKNPPPPPAGDSDIDSAIDDVFDAFDDDGISEPTPNKAMTAEQLAAVLKLVDTFVGKGKYSFKEMAQYLLDRKGEAALRKFFSPLKVAYASYSQNPEVSDDIVSKMDGSVRNIKIEEIIGDGNDGTSGGNLESNESQNQMGQEGIQDGSGLNQSGDGQGVGSNVQAGDQQQSGLSVSDSPSSNVGESSSSGVSGNTSGNGGLSDSDRVDGTSDYFDEAGVQPAEEPRDGTEKFDTRDDESSVSKKDLQDEAEKIDVKVGDIKNIAETLPYLLDDQVEDVWKAEKRFYDKGEKGILYANATGTGKTFVGLGIIKRHQKQGKNNILIVVPTQKKVADWIEEGKMLNLDIKALANTNDGGEGIVVTTYANFRMNNSLVDRVGKTPFDLIVYDESHNIISAQDAETTQALNQHRILSNLPSQAVRVAKEKHRAELDKLNEEISGLRSFTTEYEKVAQLKKKVDALNDVINKEAAELADRTKVVMLSATPFSYVKNLKYGDGLIFNISENSKVKGSFGYNQPNSEQDFFIKNFGYRMKYGKLTKPEVGVNESLMERVFADRLMASGAMSSRMLVTDRDYSREFVRVESDVAYMIDKGIESLHAAGLSYVVAKKFTYLYQTQMMEAIKAKAVIDRIKKHVALGRKVVIFHNYNKQEPSHPFDFSDIRSNPKSPLPDQINKKLKIWEDSNPDFRQLSLDDLINPITVFRREFGDDAIAIVNGTVPHKKRDGMIAAFNDSRSGVDIMVVNAEAGKEGINLHDKDGGKQRVLINLGLPVRPTMAIQQGGRITRYGQKSNAIIEYVMLGTNAEKNIFGYKIADRIRTPENLALGSKARALDRLFKEGYLHAVETDPHTGQGIGGKERDNVNDIIDDYDRAISLYYARTKKNQQTKAQEGIDYYATPEPIGYKMSQWLLFEPNERLLEPSAGHGAIGRWFPDYTENRFIEPSYELRSELAINKEAGEIIDSTFEEFDIINKFDGIAMNPPYGKQGKTAIEHLAKAFKHLRDGGRIVAIIPEGKGIDRFNEWLDSKDARYASHVADVLMPDATFERAGTKVRTRIVVIDKVQHEDHKASYPETIDLRHIGTIKDLFTEFKNITMPQRPTVVKKEGNFVIPKKIFTPAEFIHTKTGETLHIIKINGNLSKEDYIKVSTLVKQSGGYWSKIAKGFVFKEDKNSSDHIEEVIKELDNLGLDGMAAEEPQSNIVRPIYKSRLEEVIEDKAPNKMAFHQLWREQKFTTGKGEVDVRYEGLLAKEGVKKEEVDWLGLKEWFGDERKDKEEVVQYIKENNVKIKEVRKGFGKLGQREISSIEIQDKGLHTSTVHSVAGFRRMFDGTSSLIYDNGDTEFLRVEKDVTDGEATYTLIENDFYHTKYKEDELEDMLSAIADYGKNNDLFEIVYADKTSYDKTNLRSTFIKNYREILLTIPVSEDNTKNYKSRHWDEENVIVHVRMGDAVNSEGEKILFLEEIQSDWHQEGRQSGYLIKESLPDLNAREIDSIDGLNDREKKSVTNFVEQYKDKGSSVEDWIKKNKIWIADSYFYSREQEKIVKGGITINSPAVANDIRGLDVTFEEWSKVLKEDSDLDLIGRLVDADGVPVPDAPFKKSWHELALRRMLKFAASNGYDGVSWTTGMMQIERYQNEMRSKVDAIHWQKVNDKEVLINGMRNGLSSIFNASVPLTGRGMVGDLKISLDEVVGKEIADKIRNSERRSGFFEGDDLTIGGEGMKGFYDKMVPIYLNKYAKKWGSKVSSTKLSEPAHNSIKSVYDSLKEARERSNKKLKEYKRLIDSGEVKDETGRSYQELFNKESDFASEIREEIRKHESKYTKDQLENEGEILTEVPFLPVTEEMKESASESINLFDPDLFGGNTPTPPKRPQQQSPIDEEAQARITEQRRKEFGRLKNRLSHLEQARDLLEKQISGAETQELRDKLRNQLNEARKELKVVRAKIGEMERFFTGGLFGAENNGQLQMFSGNSKLDYDNNDIDAIFGSKEDMDGSRSDIQDELFNREDENEDSGALTLFDQADRGGSAGSSAPAGVYVDSEIPQSGTQGRLRASDRNNKKSDDVDRPSKSVLEEWKDTGRIDYTGRTVHSVKDIADLFYVFRSPKAETLHFIGYDSEGNIVGNIAYSSGAVNYVNINNKNILDSLTALAVEGATNIAILHNHPSGNPKPSGGDYAVSLTVAGMAETLGINKVQSIVINGDRFSHWDAGKLHARFGEEGIDPDLFDSIISTETQYDKFNNPQKHPYQEWYNKYDAARDKAKTFNPELFASYFAHLRLGDGVGAMIIVDNYKRVLGVEMYDVSTPLENIIDEKLKAYGGATVYLVKSEKDIDVSKVLASNPKMLGSKYSGIAYKETIVVGDGYIDRVEEYSNIRLDQKSSRIEEPSYNNPPKGLSNEDMIYRAIYPSDFSEAKMAPHANEQKFVPNVDQNFKYSDLQNPIRLKNIAKRLANDIGYQVGKDVRNTFVKRFSRAARGIYFHGSGLIRLRSHADLGALAHEIGHKFDMEVFRLSDGIAFEKGKEAGVIVRTAGRWEKNPSLKGQLLAGLEKKYGRDMVDSVLERYYLRKELTDFLKKSGYPIESYPSDQRVSEGVAEVVRNYVMNYKSLDKEVPKFMQIFENALDTEEGKVLKDALLEARSQYLDMKAQDVRVRVAATINDSSLEHKSDFKLTAETDGYIDAIRMQGNKFYINIIDALDPFRQLERALLKLNPKLEGDKNPLLQVLSVLGGDGKAEQYLYYRPFQRNGNDIEFIAGVKPLFEILTPILKSKKLKLYEAYLTALRNVELHKNGRSSAATEDLDVSEAVVKEIEKELGAKHLEEFRDSLYAYQRELLIYYKNSGKLSQEAFDEIVKEHQYYVPFYRYFEEWEKDNKHFNAGKVVREYTKSVVKGIKGSDREILSPIGSIIRNTFDLIITADKNIALKSLVESLRTIDTKLVQEIPKTTVIARMGVDGEAKFVFDNQVPKNSNIIVVWENGKSRYFEIPKDFHDSFFNINTVYSNFVRILSMPSRVLQAGAVQLDPSFAVRNIPRDQLSGVMYSKYGYNPFYFFKGIFSFAKKDDAYQKFLASGADQSFLTAVDQELSKSRTEKRMGKTITSRTREYASNPLKFFQDINRLSELGTRVGAFQKAFAKTGDVWKAMQEGRDIAADYAIKGGDSVWKNALMFYPFLNARTQHARMTVSTLKNHPLRSAMRGLMYVTIPTMLNWMMNNYDDDDRKIYEELPEWRRTGFLNVRIPYTESFISIPKGFFGQLFGTSVEYAMDYIFKNQVHNPADIPASIMTSLNDLAKEIAPVTTFMELVPFFLRPPLEVATNYVGFTGRPVVSEGYKYLPDEMQYNDYTSHVARILGDQLGASPLQIEHLIKAYGGGFSKYPIAATDVLLEVSGLVKPEPDLTFSILGVDARRIPVVGAYVPTEPTGNRSESARKFYEKLDELENINKTFHKLQHDGHETKAINYLEGDAQRKEDYRFYIKNMTEINKFKKLLSVARNIKYDIAVDAKKTNKKYYFDKLDDMILHTAQEFHKAYKKKAEFDLDKEVYDYLKYDKKKKNESKSRVEKYRESLGVGKKKKSGSNYSGKYGGNYGGNYGG